MRVNFNVINQKNVPALQSGTVPPAAGQIGRIFYNSEGIGMYIDNGIEWLPINTGGSGGGENFANTNLIFSGNRNHNLNNFDFFLTGFSTLNGTNNFSITQNNIDLSLNPPSSIGGGQLGLFIQKGDDNAEIVNRITLSLTSNIIGAPTYIAITRGIIEISANKGIKVNNTVGELGQILHSQGNDLPAIWADSGAATVPTLQEVTEIGNSTSQNIVLQGSILEYQNGADTKLLIGSPIAAEYSGNAYFNLPDVGGIVPVSVNGIGADSNGNINVNTGSLYRSAITTIGESVNLIPATTRPVQRLIFRGTTSISGSTFIPLTGINIGLIINLYGNIEISPDFRTPLNYFDYYEADGDSYRTKALLYYRSSVNGLQIVATSGIIGSESSIVSAYTVVIEFQQV